MQNQQIAAEIEEILDKIFDDCDVIDCENRETVKKEARKRFMEKH